MSSYDGMSKKGSFKFRGCTHFRQRIICAVLSGKSVKIKDIRLEDEKPGIREYEASFLRLIDKITNGSESVINQTGTKVFFKPGFIIGGKISHDCGTERGIGYFLEGLFCLAPFAKNPLNATMTGITNSQEDISVDIFRTVTLPILKYFGVEDEPELKIKKRGAPPNGGGQVQFTCPIVRTLSSKILLEEGSIRRIRGIAYSTRISPQVGTRMLESAKSMLLKYQQDVFIYTDHFKGNESGLSPGFALSLVAESTTGVNLSTEVAGSGGMLPEEVGKQAAALLLTEIQNRGCIDSTHQSLYLLFMVLTPETISKVRLGKLTPYTVEYIRNLKIFFGVTFKIEPDLDTQTLIFTCRGTGYKNLSKKMYQQIE